MNPAHRLALSFGLRQLRREWAAGRLWVMAAALVICMASVSSVGFFTDRVQGAMLRHAAELLAADLVIQSSTPIPQSLRSQASVAGLYSARTVSMPSMVMSGSRLKLAELKAVDDGYPLRGRLAISDTPFGAQRDIATGPPSGEVWLDARLMQALKVDVGDQVDVGARPMRVGKVLAYEPDRGGELFSIAPRLMLHLDDLDDTRLVQRGSRVSYKLLLAGEDDVIGDYRDSVRAEQLPGVRMQSLRDARPELRTALERAERFLGLAALASLLLGAAALALTSHQHSRRQLNATAVLRCLGASQGLVWQSHLVQVGSLALISGLVGGLLGLTLQEGLVRLLPIVPGNLPAPSAWPFLSGLFTVMVVTIGFALPPVWRLRGISPAQVLRQEQARLPAAGLASYLLAVGAVVLLIYRQAGDWPLTLYVLGGGAVLIGVLVIGALLLIRASGALLERRAGMAWRFGFGAIRRRGMASVVQMVALGLGVMVMVLLAVVRNELLDQWQQELPLDAPNYFLINVQPDEVQGVQDYLTAHGVAGAELFPMIRGRLVAIDDQPVRAEDFTEGRAQRLVRREFNLSWLDRPRSDNPIVAGRWWSPGEAPDQFSVEQGIAETLGIELGDRLTYRVAGQDISATVTSLRAVQWDSFRANFFVVSPSALLAEQPATFITSFHLPPHLQNILPGLVERFPSVTVLDVDALIRKVREVMDQASGAVEYVFAFTILAGIVVLLATLQASMDERIREIAVLRALGAGRRHIRIAMTAEFASIGLLTSALAALAASGVASVLAARVFQMNYAPSLLSLLTAIVLASLMILATGLASTRRVLDASPMEVLR